MRLGRSAKLATSYCYALDKSYRVPQRASSSSGDTVGLSKRPESCAPCRHRPRCRSPADAPDADVAWHRAPRPWLVRGSVCRRRATRAVCCRLRAPYGPPCHQPRRAPPPATLRLVFTQLPCASHAKARGVTSHTRQSWNRSAWRPAIRRRRATVALATWPKRAVARPPTLRPDARRRTRPVPRRPWYCTRRCRVARSTPRRTSGSAGAGCGPDP